MHVNADPARGLPHAFTAARTRFTTLRITKHSRIAFDLHTIRRARSARISQI